MKKILSFAAVFLLSLSLAAAVSVSTSKADYSSGDTVTAAVEDCLGTSIVKFINPTGSVVDIKNGEGDWNADYNTLSDSADGKYTVSASCANGAAQANFCVDEPGCTVDSQASSSASSTSSRGSGGGSVCIPNWSCDTWSFCTADLVQVRNCVDLNNCQSPKEETQACDACQESWTCSLWSDCDAGVQNRACYDEHYCATEGLKPALQKGCTEADPFPPPARVSAQLPPPYVPPAKASVEQPSFFSLLWDDYKVYILGGLAALVLAVLVLLAIHLLMPKKVAYNINELKQWVKKEKEMGTSDADIREILKQNTGWTEEEINMAFDSMQQNMQQNKKAVDAAAPKTS